MEQVEFPFFPYPLLQSGERRQGYQEPWARQCNSCDRQCEKTRSMELQTCSYGINFQRANKSLLIFGIVVSTASVSSAAKKALKQHHGRAVKPDELSRAIAMIRSQENKKSAQLNAEKAIIIADYVKKSRFKVDFFEQMRPAIQKSLSFLHDYSQFVSRVKQNINVVLHTRYVGGEIEDKLNRASEAEAAIYWSRVLMSEKLSTAFLLLHPEKIKSNQESIFKLHGLILKYIRIYNAAYKDKQVKLDVTGYSIGEVKADSSVLSVIPHTLLDNALKYSRAGSKVSASFQETWSTITFSVTSRGPKIDDDELERIFEEFYRGRHASTQEDGSGFGLHLAQFVARELCTSIQVSQTQTSNQFGYETCFSVTFERER